MIIEQPEYTLYGMDCIAALEHMPRGSVQTCVTSPPYFGLRDYGHEGQIGLEETPQEYVDKLVRVFRGVWDVLADDGTLWLNLGDSYAGSWGAQSRGDDAPGTLDGGSMLSARQIDAHSKRASGTGSRKRTPGLKPKDLMGIPWRVAFALQEDGWYLRQDIIWHKPNPMPESVTDRCTKAHEYLFLLSKAPRYYFDQDAIKEPVSKGASGSKFHAGKTAEHGGNRSSTRDRADTNMRNKRSVWSVPTRPFKGAHFAVFPPDLIRPCILAGAPKGGAVLDPFAGSGTTGIVCAEEGRRFAGAELSPEYFGMMCERVMRAYL